MTIQVIRQRGPISVTRPIQQIQVGAVRKYQVIRVPSGPPGRSAAQDIAWGPMTGGFTSGEIIDAPPLPRAANYSTLRTWTRTGVSAPRVIGIRQNDALIGSITLQPGTGKAEFTVAATGAADDVFSLVMPSPADPQFLDFAVSWGSLN